MVCVMYDYLAEMASGQRFFSRRSGWRTLRWTSLPRFTWKTAIEMDVNRWLLASKSYHKESLTSVSLWWMKKRSVGQSQCFQFSSLLWHCWFGDRKGIQPVKTCVVCHQRFSLRTNMKKKIWGNQLVQIQLKTTTATANILQPLYRTTCISWHPHVLADRN